MTINDTLEPMLDKILVKVLASVSKQKQPSFTHKEMQFLDDAQKIILLLIDKLAAGSQTPDYQIACQSVLAQALTNLRYHYERDDVSAKRLYNQIDHALSEQASHFSHPCVVGIIQSFYAARLDVPDRFKALSLEMLGTAEKQTYSQSDVLAYGSELIEHILEDDPTLTAFELSNILFESLHGMPQETAASMVECLATNQHLVAKDTAILFLLHPNAAIRTLTRSIASAYINQPLTPESLTRLVTIRQWSPISERQGLDQLIAHQRKCDIHFAPTRPAPEIVRYDASIMDGSGVQLILIETREGASCRIGGFLVKHGIGVRDAWMTGPLHEKELRAHKRELQADQEFPLFQVSDAYAAQIISHYIVLNNNNGETPEPHVLELYEHLGAKAWRAEPTAIDDCLDALIKEINPEGLTPAWTNESLEHSDKWIGNEVFTRSWFETSPSIDAVINRHTVLRNGRQQVEFTFALDELNTTGFEFVRQKWTEHFFWMALMAKSQPTPENPRLWKDFATLAYVLRQGWAMKDIPLMQTMMYDSLELSLRSMSERGSYLQ